MKIRRNLHKYAEIAWTEFRTTAKIVEFLKSKGIPVMFGLDIINPRYAWSYPEPEAYECSYDIRIMGYGPQGDGDEDMAQEIVEATGIVEDLKERKVIHNNTGAADDFTYMMQSLQDRGKRPANEKTGGDIYSAVRCHMGLYRLLCPYTERFWFGIN